MKPVCENCRFSENNGTGSLDCKRRAPYGVMSKSLGRLNGKWPVVSSYDWCGEHSFKEAPEGRY